MSTSGAKVLVPDLVAKKGKEDKEHKEDNKAASGVIWSEAFYPFGGSPGSG